MRRTSAWTTLIATAGIAVALLSAAPSASAQPVTVPEVNRALYGAEALGEDLYDAYSGGPDEYSYSELCERFDDATDQYHELKRLYQRADAAGQQTIATRLALRAMRLGDLLDEVDDDADCRAPWIVQPAPRFNVNSPAFLVNVDYAHVYSTTTFSSPFDTFKVHSNTNQVQLSSQVNFGPWFMYGQAGFAGAPTGGFVDTFISPPASTSGSVNSGSLYNAIFEAGYDFAHLYGSTDLRIYAGGFTLAQGMYGGAFPSAVSILNEHWEAALLGAGVDRDFFERAFNVKFDVAAIPVARLPMESFTGHGAGVMSSLVVSFPIPNLSLRGNVFVQETYMKASGTTTFGVPMDVKNNNLTIGAGLSAEIFGPQVMR